MCRSDIGNNDADQVAAENTPQESGGLMSYIKGLYDTVSTKVKSCWPRKLAGQSVATTSEDSGTSSGIDAFEMIVNPR